MTDEAKPCVHVHILTTGEYRNPIGSVASPYTMVSDGGGVYLVSLTQDGQPFNTEALGEEDPTLEHLEAHIRQQALGGVWKLGVVTPMWDAAWERNAEGDWICTEAGMGYA